MQGAKIIEIYMKKKGFMAFDTRFLTIPLPFPVIPLTCGVSLTTKGELSIPKPEPRTRTPVEAEKKDGPRVNRDIMARQVRLIDEKGDMQGVVTVTEALSAAEAAGLDLVEISPHSEPPVCKILDYGKYKYEMHKKAVEAKKKQKTIDIKEIKLRPTIDAHDLEIKMRAARAFLMHGHKVKVTLRFRGREMSHQELGVALVQRVKNILTDVSRVEYDAKFEGRQIVMILASSVE